MKREDILKYLDSLHLKIARSSFAEMVTENEIMALLECKRLMTPKKPNISNDYGRRRRYCPSCGSFFVPTLKYCGKCSQHIDWRDSE